MRERLIEGGHATAEEIRHLLDVIAAGRLDLTLAPPVSVRGRRPGDRRRPVAQALRDR
ncbi:hypothetical protein ACIBI3_11535 [Actinomadura luteofluorescens]|uniref:hypothetical protein n=1 Tax=Actinomadura luteofluorescens TaxID=46163 RepID=UPI00348DD290